MANSQFITETTEEGIDVSFSLSQIKGDTFSSSNISNDHAANKMSKLPNSFKYGKKRPPGHLDCPDSPFDEAEQDSNNNNNNNNAAAVNNSSTTTTTTTNHLFQTSLSKSQPRTTTSKSKSIRTTKEELLSIPSLMDRDESRLTNVTNATADRSWSLNVAERTNGNSSIKNNMQQRKQSQQQQLEKTIESNNTTQSTAITTTTTPSYSTTPPSHPSLLLTLLTSPLSFSQTLREFRHNTCLMTPLSTLVLLALLLSSLIGLIVAVPQLVVGILLGPFLKRSMWMVEFLYRWDVARWGHLKIMGWGNKKSRGGNDNGGEKGKEKGKKNEGEGEATKGTIMQQHHALGAITAQKKLEKLGVAGHSETIHQRITVVPGRVYVHPIPQFMDNLAYLIVCCPSRTNNNSSGGGGGGNNDNDGNGAPVLGVLIDCGEANVLLGYLECIYEQYYGDYPRSNAHVTETSRMGIALHAILCTHRHHDHTAGIGALVDHMESIRHDLHKKARVDVNGGSGIADGQVNIFDRVVGNVAVVGGAVEKVPHQNLFVKNGCFVPLPCIGDNDMNSVVSIEVIGVPSHTRGSVVYALRNRMAPDVAMLNKSGGSTDCLKSHLFTGDAIFSGGGGVAFEADLEFANDNFNKNPNSLKSKNGSSRFRPGAGTLSMERCFAEVLTRALGPWLSTTVNQSSDSGMASSQTLLYPGHEYTTDLIMRQFDQKNVASEGHWMRMPPSVFFETASHYFVSAHRRALPPKAKLLTVPMALAKEQVVNPNFRSLKRRGEHLVHALKLWYEFGAKNLIPDSRSATDMNGTASSKGSSGENQSIFTTMYTNDLELIVQDLRSGKLNPVIAAERIESLQMRLTEKTIGRRPIPNTLPSHKNVYLGVLALTVLGSAPSAVTMTDAVVMNMAPPVDCTDRILISKKRLITALKALGLDSDDPSLQLEDIIALLWKEAKLDYELSLATEKSGGTDVECSPHIDHDDLLELGLLKLALFGVALNQQSKYCLPCGSSRPTYDANSWTTTSKLKRAQGELVRHDADKCLLCRDVLLLCPHKTADAV